MALCRDHLVAAYHPAVFPQYACAHRSARALAAPRKPASRRLAAVT